MTQAEVARRVGTQRSAVSKWEAGARRPDPGILATLANLYRVSVDWLLGREQAGESAQPEPSETGESDETRGLSLGAKADQTDWRAIALALARAMELREETERLRVEKVEAVRAEAERMLQENIRRALDEAASPRLQSRSGEEAAG